MCVNFLYESRRAGLVIQPSSVISALVDAVEHSPWEPVVDWLSSNSKVGTLRDGAREFAVPAGLDDCAFVLNPHYRTGEHLPFGIAFVVLLLA